MSHEGTDKPAKRIPHYINVGSTILRVNRHFIGELHRPGVFTYEMRGLPRGMIMNPWLTFRLRDALQQRTHLQVKVEVDTNNQVIKITLV